jgi:hypothetical protein
MTAREAAEFDVKQQERVASLRTAPAPDIPQRQQGAQGEFADQEKCRRVQEVSATRGLKRMATAMADGEGAVEGLDGCLGTARWWWWETATATSS